MAFLVTDNPNKTGIFVSVKFIGLEEETYDLLRITLDDKESTIVEQLWYNLQESETASFEVEGLNTIHEVQAEMILKGEATIITQYFASFQYEKEEIDSVAVLMSIFQEEYKEWVGYGGGYGGADPDNPDPIDPQTPSDKQKLVDNYTQGQAKTSLTSDQGSLTPKFIPPIKDQSALAQNFSEGETCVACSIANGLEILHIIKGGTIYETYSVPYIYGSESAEYNPHGVGMFWKGGIDCARLYGAPRYELVSEQETESITKEKARTLFNNANEDSLIKNNASKAKIQSYGNIDFYDSQSVYEALAADKVVMFNIFVPSDLAYMSKASRQSGAILRQVNNDTTYLEDGHSMMIIGLEIIGGVKYWTCLNSWGEEWGYKGLCYVPLNWGRNINPNGMDWVQDCYSLTGRQGGSSHPNPPTLSAVDKTSNGAKITFTTPSSTAVLLYARQLSSATQSYEGRERPIWWPKPGYGTTATSPQTITLDSTTKSYSFSGIAIITGGTNPSYLMSVRSEEIKLSSGGCYIYDGNDWVKATPYIYDGNKWVEAQSLLYDGKDWVGG